MPLKYFCILLMGARFKITSVDELEGVKGLLQNLYDAPSTSGETKTKAGELITTINLKETE